MLRIVAGKFRGRKLIVPEGDALRPTSERMRERIFSMLTHSRYPDLYQARVADLFAGSGALGLEALSRGAESVTFVEKNTAHARLLSDSITALKAESETNLMRGSATALPALSADKTGAFDFIFMDPPYHKGLIPAALKSLHRANWLKQGTVIIAEMGSDEDVDLNAVPTLNLTQLDSRTQGKQKIMMIEVD